MKPIMVGLIDFYQAISPGLVLGKPSCRYWPSCSEYTKEAIVRYGAWSGLLKGFLRILRCHPLTQGGFDPLR